MVTVLNYCNRVFFFFFFHVYLLETPFCNILVLTLRSKILDYGFYFYYYYFKVIFYFEKKKKSFLFLIEGLFTAILGVFQAEDLTFGFYITKYNLKHKFVLVYFCSFNFFFTF